MSKKGTLGWKADHLFINEEKLNELIEKYSEHGDGTIGAWIYEKLMEYKKTDNLGKVTIEYLIEIEMAERKMFLEELEKIRKIVEE